MSVLQSRSARAKSIWYTTLVLTGTTLFARTILVYYNVYLSGKIGAVGIGVFELLMSVYLFAKTAAAAGVSLAATRMSAEDPNCAKAIMRRILMVCLLLGVTVGALLFILSDTLCAAVLDNPPGGALALKILACSLPFLSASSALGGFFIARRKMRGYAPVQILEQLIRVALTVALLEYFSDLSLSYSICSIALAISISEALCLLFSTIYYRWLTRRKTREQQSAPPLRGFLPAFTRIALPVGAGALFRASLNTVYNILVPFGFKRSGATGDRSLAAYGTVQGMALPILLYPSAVMNVLATQLVPEIAALRKQEKSAQIAYITARVLRFTLLFSFLCAGAIFFFAEGIAHAIFSNTDAAPYLRALAPLVPVMYLDMTTDGILKGLDLQMKVLAIGIVDSLLSLGLVYFLLPPWAMTGYLVTIYCGECVNTLLGHLLLRRKIKLHMRFWHDVGKPLLCIILGMGVVKYALIFLPFSGALQTIFAVCAALICSAALLLLTKTVDAEELHWLRTLLFAKARREP